MKPAERDKGGLDWAWRQAKLNAVSTKDRMPGKQHVRNHPGRP